MLVADFLSRARCLSCRPCQRRRSINGKRPPSD